MRCSRVKSLGQFFLSQSKKFQCLIYAAAVTICIRPDMLASYIPFLKTRCTVRDIAIHMSAFPTLHFKFRSHLFLHSLPKVSWGHSMKPLFYKVTCIVAKLLRCDDTQSPFFTFNLSSVEFIKKLSKDGVSKFLVVHKRSSNSLPRSATNLAKGITIKRQWVALTWKSVYFVSVITLQLKRRFLLTFVAKKILLQQ